MTQYKLNPTKAKEADTPKNQRIDATGAYKGEFTLAKKIIANSGTEGIEFTFQADTGATASWLRLYLVKADGTETFGHGLLMAAMTCMKVKQIDCEVVTVEEWDKNSNARVPVEVENYADLCNKPIGVLLQKELKDFDKFQMNIIGFFEASTGLTATDILEKRPAGALDKKIASLKDNDKRTGDGGFSSPAAPAAKPDAFADFESDIPF